MKNSIKLYPYQNTGAKFLKTRRYCLLGDEMGLGKSVQAIAVMAEVEGQVLVVCPAMLRFTWLKEVKKFTSLSVGIVSSKHHDFQKVPRVLIVSYELLASIPYDLMPSVVVFDECHYLKNMKAARTKVAHSFVFSIRPRYLFCLSGTPIKNNVGEFFSILKLLSYNPSSTNGIPIAEKSQYAFALRFSNAITRRIMVGHADNRKSMEITEYKGVRNIELLKKYLKGKYLRRTSDKVLDLPQIVDKTVNLADRDSITSKKLLKAWNEWLREGKMGEHIMQAKVASAMEKTPHTSKYIIDLVEQGEKVVVFSDHLDPCRAIVDTLRGRKLRVGLISGAISKYERELNVEEFQAGNLDALVCSIKAASIGLTLTIARNLVFNDLSWVPADIEQARKRIHRIGQDRSCVIHYMALGEIDERIQAKILEKSKLMKEIL